MTIEEVSARCYLRTTTGYKPYNSIVEGRQALRTLLDLERKRGHEVALQKDGKWLSKQLPTGSMMIWLADEDDKVIPLE
jgi:hypothetical protein